MDELQAENDRLKAQRSHLVEAAGALLDELDLIVWCDVGTVVAERVTPLLDGLHGALADTPTPTPTFAGRYVPGQGRVAEAIVSRARAGETNTELAEDYALSENAIALILAAWDDGATSHASEKK